MSFARLHELVTYLLAALGLSALTLGGELGTPSIAILFALAGASLLAPSAWMKERGWARGWNAALLGFFALQIVRGLLGGPILALGLEVVGALLVSRLYNRSGAREHQQVVALALLALLAATVLSTEISYAFIFLGFLIVLPWGFALGHLRAEIEEQHGVGTRASDRRLASRGLVGAGFLGATAALSIPLFALTGLVFLAFPRVGLGVLSFGIDRGQRVSGFGSDVELGDFGVIREDSTVVLRVVPPDLGQPPAPTRAFRLRGTSFDHYDGWRWSRAGRSTWAPVRNAGRFYAVPHRMPDPERDRPYAIVLDALEEPVVFLPPNTVGIEVPPRSRSGVESSRELRSLGSVDVRYGDADGLGLRYVAWTSERLGRAASEALGEPLDPEETRRYLQLPDRHEGVFALAREWTEGARSDEEKLARLLARLRDDGAFTYSLRTPPGRENHLPLRVFLFDARAGHCEYFSTAFAIMARAVGVPTRNVTGFLGGRYNEYGGYYAVRQGDAHSWVEAWLPGRGWVTFDPTPPARDAVAPGPGLLGAVGELYDALRTRWAQHVVGYDLRSQRSMARWLRRFARGSPSARGVDGERERGESQREPARWPWLLGAGALALLVSIARFFWRRRRREPDLPEPIGRVVGLYRALERASARAGHPRAPTTTPSEHLETLAAAEIEGLEVAKAITAGYLATRYAGAPLDEAEVRRLRGRLSEVRARPRPSGAMEAER